MKIIETGIPDIVSDDIENEKISLANSIIKEVTPIIDLNYRSKSKKLKESIKQINLINESLIKSKNELQELMIKHSRLKKIRELLGRFEKIFSVRTPTGNLRNEFVVLLKVIDKVDEKQLDVYLEKTQKLKKP